MNRTKRLKIGYLVAIVVLGVGVAGSLIYFKASPAAMLVVVCLLLIPGRMQGHFWREFFRGRRLLAEGHPRASIEHFHRFLADLDRRPWLRRLMWLTWAFYTPNVEVMTRTNVGVALLNLGELESAEAEFRAASELDPQAPLPWHNLAVVHQIRGEMKVADEALQRARDLGFGDGTGDDLARRAGELLARIEGRGTKAS